MGNVKMCKNINYSYARLLI